MEKNNNLGKWLITVTGPSASGKSFLVDKLIDQRIFNKVVSCTTRPKRSNEVEGIDYYFLSDTDFERCSNHSLFAEEIEYNGHRYGVSNIELTEKIKVDKPAITIKDPIGVGDYNRIAHSNGWNTLNVFVYVSLKMRMERLVTRMADDVMKAGTGYDEIRKAIRSNMKRSYMMEHEKAWIIARDWDLIVPGDDFTTAASMIINAIESSSN